MLSTITWKETVRTALAHEPNVHQYATRTDYRWPTNVTLLTQSPHLGPDDLSSTVRYQRDDIWHFLHYVGRFMFLIWLELPLYFFRKSKFSLGIRAGLSELASYAFMYLMWQWNPKPATFVFLLPFFLLRIGLMVGNWGQHALVDEVEPDSDYRSSITLIDVPVRHPPNLAK